jgi:hypothetical protein
MKTKNYGQIIKDLNPQKKDTKIIVRDSSVDIKTRYGLDCPGIESRWERNFPNQSRLTLALTQPPIQWVRGYSWDKTAWA